MAIRTPPPKATTARNAMLSPKRATHIGGSHSLVNSPPVNAAIVPPAMVGDDEDEFPLHARRVVFEVSERLGMAFRKQFSDEAGHLCVKGRRAD